MNVQENSGVLFMIFGATGDLAKRKLFPSLYQLYLAKKLPNNFAILGVARRDISQEAFHQTIEEAVKSSTKANTDQLNKFISQCYYYSHNVADSKSYTDLKNFADKLDERYRLQGNRIFYLAMAPEYFGVISVHLKNDGLTNVNGFTRLVIEKPLGNDLSSAIKLNEQIRSAFSEKDIYRIDHYLGKEMVQNIEVIRFANTLFEPLWNNRFIANIQITSSETVGVEERGRYYEKNGALKDMVQNHMLQMVSLLLMEPPIKLNTDEIRSEKVKVLRALRPVEGDEVNRYFVRGQYGKGMLNGKSLPPYRKEPMVAPNSNTETFVAGKLLVDNFRWAGVPIYIRTGKRMAIKSTKIIVQFKDIPMNLYYRTDRDIHPNLLVIHIQPEEGLTLHINGKKSGQNSATTLVKLNFANQGIPGLNTPEAYEKLIYDCIRGDSTNFTHWDEVALSWNYIDKISHVWENTIEPSFPNYPAGSMGPTCADELLKKDGFFWWPVTYLKVNKKE